MERTTILCSLSSLSLACNRFLFSPPKHSRLFLSKSPVFARHHRCVLSNRSFLHRNSWSSLLVAACSSHSSSLRFGFNGKHFSSLFARVVALPPKDIPRVGDEVVEQLGFEKVSEEFIEECKSRDVLFKHKKTGVKVISISNSDENKVFDIVFRTPL